MKKSELIFSHKLPRSLPGPNCLLIYDAILEKKHGAWIRRFPLRHRVRSGEALKNLRALPTDMEKILRKVEPISREKLRIVAFGGGSVGDYAGFVASLVRRGVGFVQVPSTWLAAMDSAHGGKTALNVGAFKNQIGTFYPAQQVHLVREVLLAQPSARVQEAAGEYYKMLFLMPPRNWRRAPAMAKLRAEDLWRDLPILIEAKWKIVQQDPEETKGPRAWLNLGHTVGHVLEGALRLPHGVAVHYGLAFALRWARAQGLWAGPWREDVLPSTKELSQQLRRVRSPLPWLKRDKKIKNARQIRFVFVHKPGYPVTKAVSLRDLMREWKRQSL